MVWSNTFVRTKSKSAPVRSPSRGVSYRCGRRSPSASAAMVVTRPGKSALRTRSAADETRGDVVTKLWNKWPVVRQLTGRWRSALADGRSETSMNEALKPPTSTRAPVACSTGENESLRRSVSSASVSALWGDDASTTWSSTASPSRSGTGGETAATSVHSRSATAAGAEGPPSPPAGSRLAAPASGLAPLAGAMPPTRSSRPNSGRSQRLMENPQASRPAVSLPICRTAGDGAVGVGRGDLGPVGAGGVIDLDLALLPVAP